MFSTPVGHYVDNVSRSRRIPHLVLPQAGWVCLYSDLGGYEHGSRGK